MTVATRVDFRVVMKEEHWVAYRVESWDLRKVWHSAMKMVY